MKGWDLVDVSSLSARTTLKTNTSPKFTLHERCNKLLLILYLYMLGVFASVAEVDHGKVRR